MAIKNKRTAVQKNNLDARLKSKLKENFDWMTEDDELEADPSMGNDLTSGDDMGGSDMGMDMGDGGSELDGGMDDAPMDDEMGGGIADLTQTQAQSLDSEVDKLLQMDLDSIMGGSDDMGLGDDTLAEDESDMDMDIETSTGDVSGAMGDGLESQSAPQEVVSGINTDELQSIIDSPNSLGSLEDELVASVTDEDDDSMMENEDPFKGISDLPGFDQGYEGEDVKDELMEDVELAAALKDLEFGSVSDPIGDGVKSTVKGSGKGGADSNVDTVNDGSQTAPADYGKRQMQIESIKKSKMLVKAAAAILKLKQMQESESKKVRQLQFENAKLSKVNALLAVVGDKMTKDVRKKMVESFSKCKTQAAVTALYGKVVNVIKEHARPSLNSAVAAKRTQVRTTTTLRENTERQETKVDVSRQQMRKNHLMGLGTTEDMYYKD